MVIQNVLFNQAWNAHVHIVCSLFQLKPIFIQLPLDKQMPLDGRGGMQKPCHAEYTKGQSGTHHCQFRWGDVRASADQL